MKQNIVLIGLLVIGLGAVVAIILHVRSELTPPPSPYDIPEGLYDCLTPRYDQIFKTPGFPKVNSPRAKVPQTLTAPDGSQRPLPDSLAAAYTMSQAPPFTIDVRRKILGYDFQIAVYHEQPATAEFAVDQAFRRIEGIVENMATWSEDGELARINSTAATEPVELSDDMYYVIKRTQLLATHSVRAFDITVGPAREMWRKAVRKKALPPRNKRHAVRDLISFNYLIIDDKARTIKFKKPGMMLDLTGALRGFALDQAALTLRDYDVEKGFLRSGEAYYFLGRPDDKPLQAVLLRPTAGERTLKFVFDVDRPACVTVGYFLSHTKILGQMITEALDGRTGDPAINANSCTIVGPDAMTCQMLAHAIVALGSDKAYRFIAKFNPREEIEEEEEELE